MPSPDKITATEQHPARAALVGGQTMRAKPDGPQSLCASPSGEDSGTAGETAPAHEALEKWAYPMGRPPQPTAEDRAKAEQFAAEYLATCSPEWVEAHGKDVIRQFAVAEMQKRMDREFRAAIAKSKRASERLVHILDHDLPDIRAEYRRIFEEEVE